MPPEQVDLIEIRAADTFGKPSRVEIQRDASGALVSGVVHGVRVLGARSANKINGKPVRYSDKALAEAAKLYDGFQTYLDHPPRDNPHAERSYKDRFGRIESTSAKPGDGVYGSYRVNPKHPHAEQFLWDAENNPGALGLSHNAQGRGSVQGDEFVIESVPGARSVDVVSEPATSRSLFESTSKEAPVPPESTPAAAPAAPVVTVGSPAGGAGGAAPAGAPVVTVEAKKPDTDAAVKSVLEARLAALESENAKLQAERTTREKRERFDGLLREAKLPAYALTDELRTQVYRCSDDTEAKGLLEVVKRIAWNQTPASRPGPTEADKPITNTDEFVSSFKKGK